MAKGRYKRRGKNPASTSNGTFDPNSISGLYMWYDAADELSFTYSSGVSVSQWNDRGPNGWHLVQAVVSAQPQRSGSQNGKPTVVFDGSADFVEGPTGMSDASVVDVFIAAKYDNADAIQRSIFATNADGISTNSHILTNTGRWAFMRASFVDTGDTDDSNWNVHNVTFAGASSTYLLNNTNIVTGNPGASAGGGPFPVVGSQHGSGAGASFWDGEVAEILVYSADLSAANVAIVYNYLRSKWGTV